MYQMIRVKSGTHARLVAMRERLEIAYVYSHRTKGNAHITLDDLVNELLEMKEKHMERSRKSRRRRPAILPPPAISDSSPVFYTLGDLGD